MTFLRMRQYHLRPQHRDCGRSPFATAASDFRFKMAACLATPSLAVSVSGQICAPLRRRAATPGWCSTVERRRTNARRFKSTSVLRQVRERQSSIVQSRLRVPLVQGFASRGTHSCGAREVYSRGYATLPCQRIEALVVARPSHSVCRFISVYYCHLHNWIQCVLTDWVLNNLRSY